ncbi:TolC family outer membrane protein [Litoribacillus peritrichatus]|uniref:Efflux transporter outer membrane subunit OpmH n=1 Tax=Litoribacillus peritrichatus TaxID=718191 RepID=A0ABP7MMY3_9GAMM
MYKGRLKVTAVVLSLSCAPAWSANLLDIYQSAIQKDAQLAASKARFDSRKETEDQAFSGLLPQVNLGASASFNDRTTSPNSGSDVDQETDTTQWSLSGKQVLFNGSIWNDWKAAGLSTQSAQYTYLADQQALTFRTATSYIEVLRAHENLTLRIAEEKAVGRQLEQTKQHFEVGLIPITDVHEAQASFDSTRVNRIVAQNDLNIAFEALTKLTGEIYGELDALSADYPITMPSPASAQEWVSAALNSNPALASAQYAVQAAQENVDSSRSGHYPTIDVTASYGEQYLDSDVSPSGSSGFQSGDTDVQDTVVSLNFNLPLYAGGAVSSSTRQATSDLEEARQNLIFSNRDITQQTRTLYSLVTTNVLRIDARKQAVVSSTSALEATELGYEVGTRNIVDVLIAQRNLYESQRNLTDARYDYVLNYLQLKQVSGQLAQSDMEELNQWLTGDKVTTVEVTKNL